MQVAFQGSARAAQEPAALVTQWQLPEDRYANDVTRLENRYDDFVEEFSNILQRQAHVTARRY